MKERIIQAYSNPAKLGQSLDLVRQTAEQRIKNGYAAIIYLDGKKVGYADLDSSIYSLVVNKTSIKKGWPLGKKRKPLEVTEVSGERITDIQVSQA
jgi:hypothetical protein